MSSGIHFQPDRLRQARQLALLTKKEVADASGVSPAAVGQYEAGIAVPRPETLVKLAAVLDVPTGFFAPGRPLQRLETTETHFESLRATTLKQRQRATAYAEQIWELSHALETHVRLPAVDVPGVSQDPEHTWSPQDAARSVRENWDLGTEPIGHLVAQLEMHGILCCLVPPSESGVARIDAYSTLAFRRPLVVLAADRADDVLRHRFSAAHELGHLILHGGVPSGEAQLEREADTFAAELLTPSETLREELPTRMDFAKLFRLSERWGVEVRSLIYRSQELGLISASTARRAYIRLVQSPQEHRSIREYDGEVPSLLNSAFELAGTLGITVATLADQLRWTPRRVRQLLGHADDPRPALRLVPGRAPEAGHRHIKAGDAAPSSSTCTRLGNA